MNTPKDQKPEMNEFAGLAKTFSTACKKAAAEGKVASYTAPVLTAAFVILTASATAKSYWA